MATLFAVALVGFTACDKGDNGGGDDDTDYGTPLSGSITTTRTLNVDEVYNITGPLIVEEGGKLTIPAGTVIKANKGFNNYILVLQGGQIFVNGTPENPVTMTLNLDVPGTTTNDRWGGLVVNGRAPLTAGQTGETEISTLFPYGGDKPNDDSGDITYLILEYTGAKATGDTEHNGLTLNGVGNGTTIHDIFVINGSDDGIEFFGGTVDVDNVLVVNSDDDMFDFTFGYSGKLTNAYGIWEAGYSSVEGDPNGVEADGNLDGKSPGAAGQADFEIENLTIDLRLGYEKSKFMQSAFRIRRDCKATIKNALVKGTGYVQTLINFSAGESAGDYGTYLRITNSLQTAPDNLYKFNTGDTQANYPEAQIVAGNTGCPTDIFDWTGYNF